MKRYISICLLALLCSCATQKTKTDRAINALRSNQAQLASLCAEQFPIKERVIVGKEIIKVDTIQLAGIEIPCPDSPDQKPVFVRCPDVKKITKTIFKTDTIERENTARIVSISNRLYQMEIQLKETENLRDKYKKKADTQSLFNAILIGIGLFCIAYRFKLI